MSEELAKNLVKDVQINPDDIDAGLMNQAGLYAYYASLSSEAYKRVANLKIKLDVETARLDKEIREIAIDEGRKLTESLIEKEIDRSPTIIGVRMKLVSAEAEAQLLRDGLEALKQRRDALIQIGVARREERKGEAFVKSAEHSSTENEMKNRRSEIAKKIAA